METISIVAEYSITNIVRYSSFDKLTGEDTGSISAFDRWFDSCELIGSLDGKHTG